MNTKFMDRVFSAMENQESEVLNQIENDVDIALEDGGLYDEEYDIQKVGDKLSIIKDKVNNEDTEVRTEEGLNTLTPIVPIDGTATVDYTKDGNKVTGNFLGYGEDIVKVGPDDFIPADQVDSVTFSTGTKGKVIEKGQLKFEIDEVPIIIDFKKRVAYNGDDVRQFWEIKPNTKFTDLIQKISEEIK
jgi:hypothetical protein